MNIFFNNTEIELPGAAVSVGELLKSRGVPAAGIAVAINDKVVRKSEWETTLLSQGDRVIVITAVCGG